MSVDPSSEAPAEDRAEQGAAPAVSDVEVPLEADAADAAEQSVAVEPDEDERR